MGHFVVDARGGPWFASCKVPPKKERRSHRDFEEGARSAMNAQELLQEIADYCRQTGLAESTFGRRAVNDGKLAARLRNGGRITTDTLDRIQDFMTAHPPQGRSTIIERPRDPRAAAQPLPAVAAAAPPSAAAGAKPGDPQRNFRFFDNRQ